MSLLGSVLGKILVLEASQQQQLCSGHGLAAGSLVTSDVPCNNVKKFNLDISA